MSSGQVKRTPGETFRYAGRTSARGLPVNLTGYALAVEIRRVPSHDLVLEIAATLGDQSTAPGTWEMLIATPPDVGSYSLRVRITQPSGHVRRSSAVSLLVEAA
jgi:hypothetical protein